MLEKGPWKTGARVSLVDARLSTVERTRVIGALQRHAKSRGPALAAAAVVAIVARPIHTMFDALRVTFDDLWYSITR